MRGLRLFVRPIEAADRQAVGEFLDRHSAPGDPPACGLLGKLLGDLVAVVAIRIGSDSVQIDEIVVAQGLRKKWIGRVMMGEVERFAEKLDRRKIVVDDAGEAGEFFRRVGFQQDGGRWVKVV